MCCLCVVNSYLGRYRRGTGERAHRSWTDREEETLVITLKELVAHGWKSDNEFRTGYRSKLDDAMNQQLLSLDIKINPRIISKITVWKKKSCSSLVAILKRSEVGFNMKGD